MRRLLTYLLAYAAWLVASALGLLAVIVCRAVINQVYALARLYVYGFRLTDQVALFLLGLIWLLLVVAGESYFRDGIERNDLRRRIVRVFATLLVVIVVAIALYYLPVLVAAL
jgi:hypothetical protein